MKKLFKFSIILVIISLLIGNLYAKSSIKIWEEVYEESKDDKIEAVVRTKDGGFVVAGWTKSFSNDKSNIYLMKIDKDGNVVWQKVYGGNNIDKAYAITNTKDGGFIVVGETKSFGNGGSDVYIMKIDDKGNKLWQRTYGGKKDDKAYAIIGMEDGGFIVAGSRKSFGNGWSDVYLVKIDEYGNKIWEKTYGGKRNDKANAITQTKDGGFIVAGCKKSFDSGKSDVYLIKIDEYGNKIWEKTYGGKRNDKANAITQTEDGGFVVAGDTESCSNGWSDVYLIKIDENGSMVWEKTYGGKKNDKANAITQTEDGSFIVAGDTESFSNGWSDAYLIKIDENGSMVWEKTYGGKNGDVVETIAKTEDGGFIVAGNTDSFTNYGWDVYIIKIDKKGNMLWQKAHGGSKDDKAYAITQTEDGGFVIAGDTKSFGNGKSDVYLVKIDKNGNTIWQRTYGGKGWDTARAITNTKDGGFIVAGHTDSFGKGWSDVYVIKIGKNGDILWQKSYGGKGWDMAKAIAKTKDGGFIMVGYTESFGNGWNDVYVIKIDENGSLLWQRTYGGSHDDRAYAITKTKDDGFIVAGYTKSFGNGWSDVYLIKIDENGSKDWEKTYGGRKDDRAYAIADTKDGGCIVAGVTFSFGNGWRDVYVIKMDKYGNIVWQKAYIGSKSDVAYAITKVKDYSFIMTGWTNSFSKVGNDIFLIELDENGNTIWQKIYVEGKNDIAFTITKAKDDSFVMAGWTDSFGNGGIDLYVVKVDSKGNKIFERTYGGRDWNSSLIFNNYNSKK